MNNKGLKLLSVFLGILIVFSIIYVCYDNGVFNKFINKKEIREDRAKDIKTKYEDVKLVSDEYEKDGELVFNNHLIMKTGDTWKELDDNVITLIGIANDKVYYTSSLAFKYIDLNSDDLIPVNWIKFEEKEYASGYFAGYLMPSEAIIKNNTIYYTVTSGPEKIRALSLDATKYSDIKKLATESDSFTFLLDDDNNLFYQEFVMDSASGRFVKYNLDTNEKKVILESAVTDCGFYKDKALVVTEKEVNDDYEYKLYLYDLQTLEKTYITDKVEQTESEATIYNDSIYYLYDNTIIKYDDGKREKVYEYVPKNDDDEYAVRGFDIYKNDLFKYSLGSSDNDFFVKDGKRLTLEEAKNYMEKYEVTMKNGEKKTFYEDDIE